MNLQNALGLSFSFSSSGALSNIEVDPIRIGTASSSVGSHSVANLYLRTRGDEIAYTPLLGPGSPSRFRVTAGRFEARGSWAGLDYTCWLEPAPAALAWRWRVRIDSRRDHAVELDLIYVQGVGLKTKTAGLSNGYYVSQYLERRVFEHACYGSVVCCRQNMRESDLHPWLMIASARRSVSASTDGLQFHGNTFRATGEPEALRADKLQGELSGEASLVAIQEQPFVLEAAASHTRDFVALYVPDHPHASSEADLAHLPELVASFDDTTISSEDVGAAPEIDRFRNARLLPVDDLNQAELAEFFGSAWRHIERAEGQLLSFFLDGPRHVVLRAKEVHVDRPHGHIMQANAGYLPDERILSTTAFACGVFNSHLTQGNTNFNTLLSVCTEPATPNLEGQRILVQLADGAYLLGVPSAFEMGLHHCRWIYKHGDVCLQVCTWTAARAPHVHVDVQVVRGGPVGLTLTHQFDGLNGWQVAPGATREFIATPRADSMIAGRFPRAQFRMVVHSGDEGLRAQPLEVATRADGSAESATFVLDVPAVSNFCMSFVGEVAGPADSPHIVDAAAQRNADCAEAASAWQDLSRALALRGPHEISAIDEILPWFGMNALIHYLTPYGLEQFSGAAWGTRDVCQGPIDFLLCEDKFDQAKEVLRILFAHQDPEGGWPQWWMFDSYDDVRADSAHGDVIYWCILALCSYIKASGDFSFLHEPLPYFCKEGAAPVNPAPVIEHIDKIVELAVGSFVPGTALVQFGGGDWNDSLQPVSEDLARRLVSSWTVQMCYQAFNEYREVCERAGETKRASELGELCARIYADFHRQLVKDGVVAGYGLVGEDHTIELLLHPNDARTGVRYSLLPMNRGVISGVFSKEQAEHHVTLIERHLTGPDGARLMDRPLRYRGGRMTLFQRAESSTYFGREIGLMYVHEHLRYAESLARMGRPEAFLRALRQAIPVDYHAIVPQGDRRQANCYYSSSDVLFKSRYEADERYAEVVAGNLPLHGGWRVYSSGPGIYIAHVVTRLLGLRTEFGELILDPVLAPSLDGLRAALQFRGRCVTFAYRVDGPGYGPHALAINGQPVQFERESNPYRRGGAVVPLERFLALLDADENLVEVAL